MFKLYMTSRIVLTHLYTRSRVCLLRDVTSQKKAYFAHGMSFDLCVFTWTVQFGIRVEHSMLH